MQADWTWIGRIVGATSLQRIKRYDKDKASGCCFHCPTSSVHPCDPSSCTISHSNFCCEAWKARPTTNTHLDLDTLWYAIPFEPDDKKSGDALNYQLLRAFGKRSFYLNV